MTETPAAFIGEDGSRSLAGPDYRFDAMPASERSKALAHYEHELAMTLSPTERALRDEIDALNNQVNALINALSKTLNSIQKASFFDLSMPDRDVALRAIDEAQRVLNGDAS